MPQTTEKDRQDPSDPQSSTTRELSIYHSDDEDVFIIRIDAKDPIRRQVMAALQAALEGAQPPRNEEASKAKAYAQEKLPDDWRRKSVSKGDPDNPNAAREYRQPEQRQTGYSTYAQQHDPDQDRRQQRQREEETARQKR